MGGSPKYGHRQFSNYIPQGVSPRGVNRVYNTARGRFSGGGSRGLYLHRRGTCRIKATSQRANEWPRSMRPEQCREAREKLNWTRQELAKAAEVPLSFIAAFEDGKDTPEFLAGYEVDMRRVFEDVGIGFPFEIAGGRIRGAGVTYSPRDRDETH